jgi:hypothetical protein
MKLRDPFTRLSHDTARRFRLRGIRLHRWYQSPAGRTTVLTARARERERRGLASLDQVLTADAPRLASMYEVFNQLVSADGPVTGERLPAPARRRSRRLHLALLLGLALLAGLCLTLSTQLHPSGQCVPLAASGSTVTSASTAYAQEHSTGCPAYPSQQQP